MADDKTKQGNRDDRRIDPNDPSEIKYAAEKAGTTQAAVKAAIEKVGTDRRKVEKALEKSKPKAAKN
jgi:hypothetical protein